MLIRVLQIDITHGEVGHCGKCPIALAMRRAIPETTKVAVSGSGISVLTDDLKTPAVCYPMPRSAYKFMTRFDRGDAVEPFAFHLNA